MKKADKPSASSRRRFLKGVAAASGAASAAVVAGDAVAAVDPSPATSEAGSKGYQKTEHVDSYYRSARF